MRDGWRRTQLGECLRQVQRPESVRDLEEVPYAGVRWYAEGVYRRPSAEAQTVKAVRLNRLHEGDITYNRMWATKAAFGIADADVHGCLVTSDFPIFVADRNEMLPNYLGLVFQTPQFQLEASMRAVGTTERRRLKEKDFLSIEFDLPPLDAQRRIVDLISAFDAHSIALTAELASARAVLTRRRAEAVNQGAQVLAADAFDILMGRQRSPDRATGPGMTRYLRAANIKDGLLDLSDVKEMDFDDEERIRFGLRIGDVLVSEGSGSPSAVGAAARWNGELMGPVCLQNTLLRYRAIEGVTCPSYTYHWCRWAYESGAFRDVATGTNILHIGASRAGAMQVSVPPLEEQLETCRELDSIESLTVALAVEITSLSGLRSRLTAALLSGEVALSDNYDALQGEVA